MLFLPTSVVSCFLPVNSLVDACSFGGDSPVSAIGGPHRFRRTSGASIPRSAICPSVGGIGISEKISSRDFRAKQVTRSSDGPIAHLCHATPDSPLLTPRDAFGFPSLLSLAFVDTRVDPDSCGTSRRHAPQDAGLI